MTPRSGYPPAGSPDVTFTGVRVGCDVQSVDVVDQALERFGSRYLDRVYTSAEQADCRSGGAPSLAGRFAAKEAVLKLLGTADGVDPRNVEVIGAGGRPHVRLCGEAARLAEATGTTQIDVSISHDGALAFAVAVALADLPATPHQPDHHSTNGDPR